jgi:uncharacterized peroxidase-related enzyme
MTAALAPVDPATATGRAATLLAQVQKTLGLTPNMTKVMANSPALLEGYLALSGALGKGVLPAGVRELLAISTAEHNGCAYCLSAHTYLGASVAKIAPAELELARTDRSGDPHTQALLVLSEAVLDGRAHVQESVLTAARQAGVTDAEIGEVVGHIALNVLTNYFNVLAGVENDWPVVRPAHSAA